jgi:hypothetical protein
MARESAGFLSLKGGRSLLNDIKLRQDPWAAQNMFMLVNKINRHMSYSYDARRVNNEYINKIKGLKQYLEA